MTTHGGPTKTDPHADDWAITDEVLRLRAWGTDRMHPLAPASTDERVIGSADACWLRLTDAKGRISRAHAAIVERDGRWYVRDLGSKNGTFFDGVRRDEAALEPGLEIKIGGTVLVAESARSAALRGFLGRIIGWKTEQTAAVDLGLRSLRLWAAHRATLVICGADDLVMIARSLHRRALGLDRPFILCDPRRKQSPENVRNAENYDEGLRALAPATRGTLCVWAERPPHDFDAVKRALQDPDNRVHLTLCARDAAEASAFDSAPITIPILAQRAAELPRVVEEYADDAVAELGFTLSLFTREDRDWVLANESASLPEIEKATARLLAIRHDDGNLNRAAARLGMARMSLYKWIGRRKLPIRVVAE